MQNKIWEQVGQFLNRLRCENVTRDTAVEMPGYRETQEEMEALADAGAYGRHGKEMSGCQILDLLCNEKTAGNLLLQKTYVADPITKDKRKNGGELQKYFVEGSHEAILDAETYGKVVAERERRLESRICGKWHYPFSSRIICGHCGKNFVRHPVSKDKYEWVCRVHSTKGTARCPMRGISEEMLERLTAEAMKLYGMLVDEDAVDLEEYGAERFVEQFDEVLRDYGLFLKSSVIE